MQGERVDGRADLNEMVFDDVNKGFKKRGSEIRGDKIETKHVPEMNN